MDVQVRFQSFLQWVSLNMCHSDYAGLSIRKLSRSRTARAKGTSVRDPEGNSTFKLGHFEEDISQGLFTKL